MLQAPEPPSTRRRVNPILTKKGEIPHRQPGQQNKRSDRKKVFLVPFSSSRTAMASETASRPDRRRRSMCAMCEETRADVVHIVLRAEDRILTYQCPSCRQTWTTTDSRNQFVSLGTHRIA